MPLKLITGPVNSGKAGLVLDGVQAAAADGRDPVLVVPTAADSDRLRRELAGREVGHAVRVTGFRGLWELLARRLGVEERPLSGFRLRRVARTVIDEELAAGRLAVLAGAAGSDGFAPALVDFVEELGEVRASPAKFEAAMEAWSAAAPSQAAYAAEVALLCRRYRERLAAISAADESAFVTGLLALLEESPGAWGESPVFFYGFDDLSLRQLDTVAALAGLAGSEVVVSFPFEDREAFEARRWINGRLEELAGAGIQATGVSTSHYADASAGALGGLERELFRAEPSRVDPGAAVERIVGGGERAEMELVAARVRSLIEGGTDPSRIAVAIRDLETSAPLVEEVFAETGVAITMRRRVRIGETALVRAVLALLDCALCDDPTGAAGARLAPDFLLWLRASSGRKSPGRLDRLEQEYLRGRITTLAELEERWLALTGFDSNFALDGLREAFGEGPARGYRRAGEQARRLLAESCGAGSAPTMAGAELVSAAALGDLVAGFEELEWLVGVDPAFAPSPADLTAELADREIEVGESAEAGAVTVAPPLDLRARRVDALLVPRMQEGLYPMGGRDEPFLDERSRAAVDAACRGAGIPALWPNTAPDRVEAERHLLHALLTRAEKLLAFGHHLMSDLGDPVNPTLFQDDIEALFDPEPSLLARPLGAIEWPPEPEEPRLAPSDYQRGLASIPRAQPEPGPYSLPEGPLREALGAREQWSATTLEAYLRCPMSWLVDRYLRPWRLEPDADNLAFGSLVHDVLQELFSSVPEEARRPNDENLPALRARLDEVLGEVEPTSPDPVTDLVRRRSARRAILNYLDEAAASGTGFSPASFELEFGGEKEPVDLGGGLLLAGKIDRVDLGGDRSIIIDYKTGKVGPDYGAKKAVRAGNLQAGLYALAYGELDPGHRPAASLYQRVAAQGDLRPRGAVSRECDPDREDLVGGDRVDEEAFDEMLAEARAAAIEAIAAIRGGELEPPDPENCAFGRGSGCAYPGICRRLR